MKSAHIRQNFVKALVAAVLACCLGAQAASTSTPTSKAGTNNPATNKGGTNAAPAEIPIPESIFVIPKSRAEGVDPFFPQTVRIGVIASTSDSTKPAPVRAELAIKGFSGTIRFPLVIINDKTFAVGDDKEVATQQGKTRVRCIEIRSKDESAVIEVGGERRELRFRAK